MKGKISLNNFIQENMKRNIIYSLTGILIFVLTACTDDWLNNEGERMPEGEVSVSATVEFLPLRPALDVNTRTAGDVIKDINDLCVLLYDEEGNLVKSYYLLPKGAASTETTDKFDVDDIDRTDTDAEGDKTAETKTKRATFKLAQVPYGYYYMYAVANMGNLAESEKDNIQTVDKLKSINLTWEAENWFSTEETTDGKVTKATKNHKMFGYFTTKENTPAGANRNTEASRIAINKKDMELHAWIRRAASKVTIAYDASGLKEGVFIYLKSVQIKDTPVNCYLGKTNTPSEDEQSSLIKDGEIIKYYTGTTPPAFDESYPVRLATGRAYYPCEENGTFKYGHEEAADALFFFENMQGDQPYDKRQDADKDGELDHPGLPPHLQQPDKDYSKYRPKDNVPYGTYIEVDAYYRSINEEKVGSGDIKYRFMLGKNITTNYDAERNHHYKLTLKFKNFANDADWHIEYAEPEPGIEVPNPYYISYLYNRTMDLPIKINPGYAKVESVKAEIINNGWAPIGADANNFDYYHFDLEGKNVWNGFLSLRRTTATILTTTEKDASEGSGIVYAESNQEYYNRTQRGNREYAVDPGIHEDTEYGNYSVRKEEGTNILHMSIPLYTRAKQMIAKTSYTGNNPYVAYRRQAKIKITATLSQGEPLTEIVDIFQVRRVVNPKGIYRRHNNDKPFHVVLKRLARENATNFEEFTSEGAWEAVVAATTHEGFVKLEKSSSNKYTSIDEHGTLKGLSGSVIDFKITFNGTCTENESRHAVIRVSYHNNTCNHLIFVRQGYAPVALLDEGRAWHTFNMKTATEETDSPVEEGSLFKWGNLNEPIDASSNKHEKEYWIEVQPKDFKDDKAKPLKIAGKETTKLWDEITSQPFNTPFEKPRINGKEVEIANYDDYNVLYKSKDIEMGYGVLYGDDAEETLSDINEIYGYRYGSSGTYGMRGCFIYNKTNGRNLFFPIGASGYGHRKQGYGDMRNWQGVVTGQGYIHGETKNAVVLRYSAGRSDKFNMTAGDEKPLFYDLYMRPGAIYWLQRVYPPGRDGESDIMAWDINYFSFDFNLISKSNVYATLTGENKIETPKSDACFIRCVEP